MWALLAALHAHAQPEVGMHSEPAHVPRFRDHAPLRNPMGGQRYWPGAALPTQERDDTYPTDGQVDCTSGSRRTSVCSQYANAPHTTAYLGGANDVSAAMAGSICNAIAVTVDLIMFVRRSRSVASLSEALTN